MGSNVSIRPATLEDIPRVAEDMRPEDVQEVLASNGHCPDAALRSSYLASRWCYTVYDPTHRLAMFGVADLGGGRGSPWMLATPRLARLHSPCFVSGSRAIVARMREEFTCLENFVDSRNLTSIRWLRWLGFTIHPAAPHGVSRLPFHRFTWIRS